MMDCSFVKRVFSSSTAVLCGIFIHNLKRDETIRLWNFTYMIFILCTELGWHSIPNSCSSSSENFMLLCEEGKETSHCFLLLWCVLGLITTSQELLLLNGTRDLHWWNRNRSSCYQMFNSRVESTYSWSLYLLKFTALEFVMNVNRKQCVKIISNTTTTLRKSFLSSNHGNQNGQKKFQKSRGCSWFASILYIFKGQFPLSCF